MSKESLRRQKNSALLQSPEFVSETDYVAPRTKLEENRFYTYQEILSIKRVDIHDDFFCIGGSLITVNQFTAACQRDLQIDIPSELLVKSKTIAKLSPCINKFKKVIIPCTEVAQYPLSFAQEQLLFIEKFEEGSDLYHIPYFVQLSDNANLVALEAAFNVVIHRHAVLNSVYRTDKQNKNYQDELATDVEMYIHVLDAQDELLAVVKNDISRPFDLTHEPSLRLHCYKDPSHRYLLMLFHHIAFDGWSNELFINELSAAYQALCQGKPIELPDLGISYGDYALWQRHYLQGDILNNLLDFWRQQISGVDQLRLPNDYPRSKQSDHQGRKLDFKLDACLSEDLRALAKAQETTLYSVLLSSFYITLSAMSGQTDIVLGTPSDNREHAQTQSLIGMFVNALVLRCDVQLTTTIDDLIKQVHQTVTQAKSHQALPFERLVDVLNVKRDPSRHPIFQVMFAIEPSPEINISNHALPFLPFSFSEEDELYSPAKFDLTLSLQDSTPTITGSFNYAVSLFDEVTIKRMSDMYQRVLKGVVSNQQQCIGEISLLSDIDRQTLLHTWNDTTAISRGSCKP